MKEAELTPWTFLGRLIGFASSWDQTDDFGIFLYDLKPVAELAEMIPSGVGVGFMIGTGRIEQYAEDGTIILSLDILRTLAKLDEE